MRYIFSLLGLLFGANLWAQSLPTPTGFVTDYTTTLSTEQRNALNTKLSTYAQQTSNEVAVAILNLPEGEDPELYTNQIARTWGIGQAKEDNGVLLVVYKNVRKVRIEVGYGLEPVITDGRAKLLITEIIAPKLRSGDFYGGISAGADELCALASKEYNKTQLNKRYFSAGGVSDVVRVVMGIVVLAIALIVGIIMIVWRGKNRRGGNRSRGRYHDDNSSGGGFIFWGGGGWGNNSGSSSSNDSSGFSGGDFGGFSGGDFGGGGASGDY